MQPPLEELPEQRKRRPMAVTNATRKDRAAKKKSSGGQAKTDKHSVTDRQASRSEQEGRRDLILLAFASAATLWASFAPLGWGWLGWLAPAGWVAIAARKTVLTKLDYFLIWLSGAALWLALLQGVRLAYWPLYFGWVALSLYVAIYVPLFVAGTRILMQRGLLGFRLPLVLAAPVSWVAFELVRSYVITGFSSNMLVHTQAHHPMVIQLADQLGGYGVSFVMMTACATIVQLAMDWKILTVRRAVPAVSWASILIVFTLFYGWWRLSEAEQIYQNKPLLNVLLVQENMPTRFDSNLDSRESWTSYVEATRDLTLAAAQPGSHKLPDLIVWPESTFTGGVPWVESSLTSQLPDELKQENYDMEFVQQWIQDTTRQFRWKVSVVLSAVRGEDYSSLIQAGMGTSAAAPAPNSNGNADSTSNTSTHSQAELPCLLLGSDAMEIGEEGLSRFNSALMVGADGNLIGRYDKMHLVMFGEYIPLGPLLKWLGDMFGMGAATAGTEAKCFEVNGAQVAPNICFESAMPRVIARQVSQLARRGNSPDLLINVTNDSWFRGSSILEHHLACSMLCAVENRRPFLVAANSGISAEIDGCGRLVQSLDRFVVDGIWARPAADGRWGLVQTAGYPLAWLCALMVGIAYTQLLGRRFISDHSPDRPGGRKKRATSS